jgi:hypothetical protein
MDAAGIRLYLREHGERTDPRRSSPRSGIDSGARDLQEATMTLGPLEYTVIGFEGNRFNGEIAKELSEVIDSGTIALVDLVFITKDIDGNATSLELDNKDDPRFAGFTGMLEGLTGLLTEEDIDNVAADLAPNTSALVIMFEHRWAVRLKEAMGAAGGFLVARETIRPETLEMLNAEIESAELTA